MKRAWFLDSGELSPALGLPACYLVCPLTFQNCLPDSERRTLVTYLLGWAQDKTSQCLEFWKLRSRSD